jgi:hypothetical protein
MDSECMNMDECGDGEICVDNMCVEAHNQPCVDDADCPEAYFDGSEECIGGDVKQPMTRHGCLGAVDNKVCTRITYEDLIEDCATTCTDGVCD